MSEISKTADKALSLLLELSDGERATPQQLSRRMSENRTVVQRLLVTLLARGFVVKTTGGEYVLAPRVGRLADLVETELRQAARSSMEELRQSLSETVVLHIADGDDAVVLMEEVPSSQIGLQVRREVGSRSSLHLSASGLVLLAFLPSSFSARILKGVPGANDIAERLAQVQFEKVAFTSGQWQEGISGLAVPVFSNNQVVASLAVLVPTPRESDLQRYVADLHRQADRIESLLK